MTTKPDITLRIVLIGTGHVAWHLGPALKEAGHVVEAVYGRSQAGAAVLAARVPGAAVHPTLDFTAFNDCLFVLAIADQALPAILAAATFPAGSMVVHTSGNQPLAMIEQAQPAARAGVLYPVQTFSKAKAVDFRQIPFCVEGADEAVVAILEALARGWSEQVLRVTSEERSRLHVAAVFACNFTNHLLGISFDFLKQTKLPPTILHNLIRETFEKAMTWPPFAVQTGPAVRHDERVLQDHLHLLSPTPVYQDIYQLLSQSIQRQREMEQGERPPTPPV